MYLSIRPRFRVKVRVRVEGQRRVLLLVVEYTFALAVKNIKNIKHENFRRKGHLMLC